MFEKSLYQKARIQMNIGNEEKGLEILSKLMSKKPNLEMKVFYAFYLMKNGDFKSARKVFDELIFPCEKDMKKASKDIKVQVKQNYALLLWKEGNLAEAIKITEEIIKDYKNTVVYGNLGYFYVLDGQKEKALEFNLEAYDFASDDAVICDNLAYSYYLNEEYDKAEEIYASMHNKKNPPSFPEGFYNYGLVALKKGDKEKAKELFEKALLQKFSNLSDLDKVTVEKALAEL